MTEPELLSNDVASVADALDDRGLEVGSDDVASEDVMSDDVPSEEVASLEVRSCDELSDDDGRLSGSEDPDP